MACASTSVYELDSMVIGEHVYKCVWTPLTDKSASSSMQEDKEPDEFAANDRLQQSPKERHTYQKRDIKYTLIFS